VPASPKILQLSWGQMEVEGLAQGKDFVLYPGGGHEWDWSVTGMRHNPGIQPADVAPLLEHGVTDIVLSQGMQLVLQVDPATISFLEARGVTVHVAQTELAVTKYNQLTESAAVAGLFHSTC
jgi:hypothetical protein